MTFFKKNCAKLQNLFLPLVNFQQNDKLLVISNRTYSSKYGFFTPLISTFDAQYMTLCLGQHLK